MANIKKTKVAGPVMARGPLRITILPRVKTAMPKKICMIRRNAMSASSGEKQNTMFVFVNDGGVKLP